MKRNADHHERDAGQVDGGRELTEDEDADHGRRRGQQGDEERVRGASQPRHRQLVEDEWDDGR